MSWRVEYRCVACKQALSFFAVMHSHGCCPLCGHKQPGKATVCDCTEHPYRLERKATGRPWWQFWKPAFTTVRIYRQP